MQLKKIQHYLARSRQLGLLKTAQVSANRFIWHFNELFIRRQAINKQLHHSWQKIQKKHATDLQFEVFFHHVVNRSYEEFDTYAKTHCKDITALKKNADELAKNCFEILGSQKQQFKQIPWHDDFRLAQQNSKADYQFDGSLYYNDFIIEPGNDELLQKDIKVPWELSRFQHLYTLGLVYHQTNDKKYADVFVEHANDWIEQNPLLLGPNWVCPMDVGIRALNSVWAFYFFRNSTAISIEFWRRFVCSLYDHFWYLENNWELYEGPTSNHYLSDLIGYYSLCLFFDQLTGIDRKKKWCYESLLHESNVQIFDEGTSYEGSTAYHHLVTEIFYQFWLLSRQMNILLPDKFTRKLQRMMDFINWCKDIAGNSIQIGDNDSGKIIAGINDAIIKSHISSAVTSVTYFKEFGISIIKTDKWHVSLRHHAYKKNQPSGHFHNDAGSITVCVNGIPIFVDPGSYIYTPSRVWRNRFRSVTMHNTFYVTDTELIPFDERLFELLIPEGINTGAIATTDENITMYTTHTLYEPLQAHRSIELDLKTDVLTITDWWSSTKYDQIIDTKWNFTLHPSITPEYHGDYLVLKHSNKNIAYIKTEFPLCIVNSLYSESYGKVVHCYALTGTKDVLQGHKLSFLFSLC